MTLAQASTNPSGGLALLSISALGVLLGTVGILWAEFLGLTPELLCPNPTFLDGHLGRLNPFIDVALPLLTIFSAMFGLMPFGVMLGSRNQLSPAGKPWVTGGAIKICLAIALCGLTAAGLLVAQSRRSYFCAMPSGIMLHRSWSGPHPVLAWGDIISAEARCYRIWLGKGGVSVSAGAVLTFANGMTVPVNLATGGDDFGGFAVLKTILAARAVPVSLGASVTPTLCPSAFYQRAVH